MTNMTKEQRENVMIQGRKMMDTLSEGKSARDVMAQIYVDNLDDKTMNQGYAMADAIIARVKEFDNDYHEAQNNIDKYLTRFQRSIDKNKTPAERCTYWLRFTATLSASGMMMSKDNSEESIDPKLTAEQIEAMSVTDEEATPEYEQELHEKAIEAIKNSGILLTGLMEHAETIKEMDDSTEAASFIVDMGTKETEYRAIVSMLVYTNAKNGTFDNIPAEMTLDQITTLVCTEVEQVKIMSEVGAGRIAEDVATFLLQVLGAIAIVIMFTPLAVLAMGIVTELFGAILVVPAMLVTFFGIIRLTGAAVEAWAKDSRKIVKFVTCAIKAVVKGVIAIANFVYKNVIKRVFDASKKLLDSLKNKVKGDSVKETVTHSEPIPAQ